MERTGSGMNFTQLTEAFETYMGGQEQADPAQLALWFNEAQLDLSWELGRVASPLLTLAAGEEYEPPGDCLQLLGCDLPYRLLAGGRLLFEQGGRGRLYYRQRPASFSGTDGGQESELPSSCHYLLALFAVSRYWDAESEGDGQESALANKWLSYYYQGKSLARSRLPQGGADISGWAVQ